MDKLKAYNEAMNNLQQLIDKGKIDQIQAKKDLDSLGLNSDFLPVKQVNNLFVIYRDDEK